MSSALTHSVDLAGAIQWYAALAIGAALALFLAGTVAPFVARIVRDRQ